MHELLRIWRRVEALPVTAGVDQDWKDLLGDDLCILEPYLKPEQQLATTYTCPHPVYDNCPRRVVHHGPDDIVAVCGNAPPQCDPVTLTRRDLVVRSLDTKNWLAAVTKCLREINGLDAIEMETPDSVVALGTLNRRGRSLAVVWIRREVVNIDNLVHGIRATTGAADLIAVLPPSCRGQTDRLVADGVALLTVPKGDDGRLDLYRALDLLDPSYRKRRIDDPTAIFDDVRIEFADEPGDRHLVRINGQEYGGFQRSDLKFLRLLLLAAARRQDVNVDDGGWLGKHKLQGDEKDHDLEALREELRRHNHPSLSAKERVALVKRSPNRDGKVRLAMPPANIVFDESLAELQLIGEQQTKSKSGMTPRTPGQKARADNFAQGVKVAKKLLDAARKLGVPAPAKNTGRGE